MFVSDGALERSQLSGLELVEFLYLNRPELLQHLLRGQVHNLERTDLHLTTDADVQQLAQNLTVLRRVSVSVLLPEQPSYPAGHVAAAADGDADVGVGVRQADDVAVVRDAADDALKPQHLQTHVQTRVQEDTTVTDILPCSMLANDISSQMKTSSFEERKP